MGSAAPALGCGKTLRDGPADVHALQPGNNFLHEMRQFVQVDVYMIIGEHQLALLLSVARVSTPRTIDNTVRAAVSLFLHGVATGVPSRKTQP
jgi:hypothetical protein